MNILYVSCPVLGIHAQLWNRDLGDLCGAHGGTMSAFLNVLLGLVTRAGSQGRLIPRWMEAAEACLQVCGVTGELGSANITPRRSTSSSSPIHPSVPSPHPLLPPVPLPQGALCECSIYFEASLLPLFCSLISVSICFLHVCFSLPKGGIAT